MTHVNIATSSTTYALEKSGRKKKYFKFNSEMIPYKGMKIGWKTIDIIFANLLFMWIK